MTVGPAARSLASRDALAGGLAAVAIVVFAVWSQRDGGYAPEDWLPGTLLILALGLTALASADFRGRLAAAPLAPALLGLYALWSFASMIWSQVPADAWNGANRTLLYAIVFAFFFGLPIGRSTRMVLVVGWAFVVTALGLVEFLRAASASGPHGFFIVGRLALPISYPNANAALFGMAFLPLQVLASRRQTPVALRLAAVAASTVLLELLLVCQSRGSIVALALSLLVYLAVGRMLLRAIPLLAVTGAAAVAALSPLLHVYTAVIDGNGYTAALSSAREALIVSTVVATAVAGLVIALDLRLEVPAGVLSRLRQVALGSAGVGAVAAIAALLAFGHPVGHARAFWHDFTTNKRASPQTVHLESGVGTSRYDVYRIALDQFWAHPIGGDGSDNYLVAYLKHRRTGETSRYPESVELRVLSETGTVGVVLFFGFLAVALRRALRNVRRDPVADASLATLVCFAFWFFHASVDWLWEFPALAAPALAFLALSNGGAADRGRRPSPEPGARRVVLIAATGLSAVAAALSLFFPWVSLRQIDSAVAARAATPAVYAQLRNAAWWNPLSEEPAIAEATIAANAGDRTRERQALEAAGTRNPYDWYVYLMLGVVDGREHRLAAARTELAKARRLSPIDPVVIYAQRRLRWGIPLTEREIGAILDLRSRTLRGVVQR